MNDGLRWAAHHPLAAVSELQIVLKNAPSVVRNKRIKTDHSDEETVELAEAVMTEARQEGRIPHDWSVLKTFPTHSNVAVMTIGKHETYETAMLKIGLSEIANNNLSRHGRVIADLAADKRLAEWKHFVPAARSVGEINGHRYLIEETIAGRDLAHVNDGQPWLGAYESAIAAIDELHDATGSLKFVNSEMFTTWFEPSLELLTSLCISRGSDLSPISSLRQRLYDSLEGKSVWISRTHGDYHPGNVLMNEDNCVVTGILDWDRSSEESPSFLDIAYQALSAHIGETGKRFGEAVYQIANGADNNGLALDLLDKPWAAFRGDPVDAGTMILAVWLKHIGDNLSQSHRYSQRPIWVHRTVDVVLSHLARRNR